MDKVNMSRINTEEVNAIADSINMSVIGYKKGKKGTDVIVECKNQHTYSQRLDSFKISKGCKYCNHNTKYTYDQVKEYVENFNFKLLSKEYFGINFNLTVECEEGHVFTPTFHNFLHNNSRCPKCNGGTAHTYNYIKNYIEEKGFVLISDIYINSKEDLSIKCSEGHITQQSFDSFKNYKSCSKCANSTRKFSYDYVKQYIESFGYFLLDDNYINKEAKMNIMCAKGHKYEVTFGNFKNGENRCPKCSISKGEQKISNVLKKLGVIHISQHRFKNCRNINTLPFDFYIPHLNLCIEYDGEQHFKHIKFFCEEKEDFEAVKIRDEIKNKYCSQNNIELIRIPYWDFDKIEEILTERIKL